MLCGTVCEPEDNFAEAVLFLLSDWFQELNLSGQACTINPSPPELAGLRDVVEV